MISHRGIDIACFSVVVTDLAGKQYGHGQRGDPELPGSVLAIAVHSNEEEQKELKIF